MNRRNRPRKPKRHAARWSDFLAGLGAAAAFHETRAGWTDRRLEHLRANPSVVPEDLFFDMENDLQMSAAQDRLDARQVRATRLPSSLPAAAREAERALREEYERQIALVTDQRNRSQGREEALRDTLKRANPTLAALLRSLAEPAPSLSDVTPTGVEAYLRWHFWAETGPGRWVKRGSTLAVPPQGSVGYADRLWGIAVLLGQLEDRHPSLVVTDWATGKGVRATAPDPAAVKPDS